MKIDTGKIEGYSEMTAEEKLAALENFEYEDNAAELERYKNLSSKANSEAAELKRKLKKLSEEDGKRKSEEDERIQSMQQEIESLKRDKTVSDYTAKMISQGYSKKLAEKAANALADGDMESYFSVQVQHNEDFKKSLKAEILKDTPRPDEPGAGKGMTMKDFRKLSPGDRHKYAQEHPEEYKKLYGGNT